MGYNRLRRSIVHGIVITIRAGWKEPVFAAGKFFVHGLKTLINSVRGVAITTDLKSAAVWDAVM